MGAPMDADDIRRIVAESVALKERFFAENAPLLLDVGWHIVESLRAGGRVLAFGNGGSAPTRSTSWRSSWAASCTSDERSPRSP